MRFKTQQSKNLTKIMLKTLLLHIILHTQKSVALALSTESLYNVFFFVNRTRGIFRKFQSFLSFDFLHIHFMVTLCFKPF